MTVLEKPRTAEEYRAWWEREYPSIPFGYCCCECGQETNKSARTKTTKHVFKGEPKRFIQGHNEPGDKSAAIEKHRDRWRREYPSIRYGYCCCGCGQKTNISASTNQNRFRLKGEPQRFLKGHNTPRDKSAAIEKYRNWWLQEYPSTPYGECLCGCGAGTELARYTDAKRFTIKGEPLRYRKGHTGGRSVAESAPPPPVEPTEPLAAFDGICISPGCITRINREQLRKGLRVCMKCDKEKSA